MKKIVISRRKTINSQCSITLTQEAADCLLEVIQDTGLSAKQAASTIITQAVKGGMIVYEEED